jgi:LuxR family transcriptional regulator, transcriptional regulator of spore coat protein
MAMTLTKREQEVLGLIATELTTEQIAHQLGVSVSTIETHRQNLFKKLGAKSVVGLIKEAIKQGLIAP